MALIETPIAVSIQKLEKNFIFIVDFQLIEDSRSFCYYMHMSLTRCHHGLIIPISLINST